MKYLLLIAFLVFAGCAGKHTDEKAIKIVTDNTPPADTVSTAFVAEPETVDADLTTINLNDSTEVKCNKLALYNVDQWFAKSKEKGFLVPYKAWEDFIFDEKYKAVKSEFTSEVGQDDFYVLYAYFLKKVNDSDGYNAERDDLVRLYHKVNQLCALSSYGGTYYGHMQLRLNAYTEYSLLKKINNTYKPGPISKTGFITLLRTKFEKIEDGDPATSPEEKIKLKKELNSIIGDISSLITTDFQLNETKLFFEDNYRL